MAIQPVITTEVKDVVDTLVDKLNQELWKVNHQV